MSLINRVLQDLEKRQAGRTEDLSFSGYVRSVTPPARSAQSLWMIGLAVLLGMLMVAAYVWVDRPGMWSAMREPVPDSPVATTQAAGVPVAGLASADKASIDQQVETALIIPVFQLTNELATLPELKQSSRSAATVAATTSANPAVKVSTVAPVILPAKAPTATAPSKDTQARKTANAIGPVPVATLPAVAPPPPPEPTRNVGDADPIPTGDGLVVKTPSANDTRASGSADEVKTVHSIARTEEQAPIEKQTRRLSAYERAENEFRRGVASLRLGRLSEAEAQFRSAIAEDRSHGDAHRALAGILIDSGRYIEAESVLQGSIEANPHQPDLAMVMARLQVERGALQAAGETLRESAAHAQGDAEYRAFFAAVLQRASDHEQAVAEYRAALALAPVKNPVWLMGLGISLRALGENRQAVQAFSDAGASKRLAPGLQAFVEQQQAELRNAAN